jgi:GDP-4-dehydro-6-deoxy-D-mannose reductase
VSTFTGEGQSFARQIVRIRGQQEPVLRVGALDRWRDFLDVADVCAAYAVALTAKLTRGAVYNISFGIPRRIGDILDALRAQSGIQPRIQVEPQRLRSYDVERVAGNSARASRELYWMTRVPWTNTIGSGLKDWRNCIY